MDSNSGDGTHWVAMKLTKDTVTYFDSFGLPPPEEIKTLRENYIYNSAQYQENSSVLCGYYCIYFINELSKNKRYSEILKPFSMIDYDINEKYIKSYFI